MRRLLEKVVSESRLRVGQFVELMARAEYRGPSVGRKAVESGLCVRGVERTHEYLYMTMAW